MKKFLIATLLSFGLMGTASAETLGQAWIVTMPDGITRYACMNDPNNPPVAAKPVLLKCSLFGGEIDKIGYPDGELRDA